MLGCSIAKAISITKKAEYTHKEVGVSYRNFAPMKRDFYGRTLQNTVRGRL